MPTFLELVQAGEADPEAIDDFVERWHEGEGGGSLREFLGFRAEEYAQWVHDPDALQTILATRQHERSVHHAAE